MDTFLLGVLVEYPNIKEIAGNRLVWRHIQEEQAFVQKLEKFSIPQGLDEEAQKMILDPLGYDPIKDVDELMCRNRRRTDGENADYKRWKDNSAERR